MKTEDVRAKIIKNESHFIVYDHFNADYKSV